MLQKVMTYLLAVALVALIGFLVTFVIMEVKMTKAMRESEERYRQCHEEIEREYKKKRENQPRS